MKQSLESETPIKTTTAPMLQDWGKLLFNHMDAWVAASLISLVALALHDNISITTMLLVLTMGIGYGAAFALNDFYDAPADALDERKRKRNFFVKHPISERQMFTAVVLLCAPLLLVFWQFGWRSWIVIGFCLLVMWGYSAPPLRFKDRPGVDLLVHALFVETFPYAVCLFLPAAVWTPLDYVILTIMFLTSLTAQLEQQIRDYEVDLKSGTRNFVTHFGRPITSKLLKGATLLLSIIATVTVLTRIVPLWLAPIPIIALPAMAHRFARDPYAPRSEKLINTLIIIGLIYVVGAFLFQLLW